MANKPLKPRDELLALFQTANATVDRVFAATGIPKMSITRFFEGYRELSIDDLLKIRQFLVDTIRQTMTERAAAQ